MQYPFMQEFDGAQPLVSPAERSRACKVLGIAISALLWSHPDSVTTNHNIYGGTLASLFLYDALDKELVEVKRSTTPSDEVTTELIELHNFALNSFALYRRSSPLVEGNDDVRRLDGEGVTVQDQAVVEELKARLTGVHQLSSPTEITDAKVADDDLPRLNDDAVTGMEVMGLFRYISQKKEQGRLQVIDYASVLRLQTFGAD